MRKGVYYRTNPNSLTGEYLFPEQTQRHAIKVFVPGLVRSDRSFINNVVGTIRPWREYVSSLRRLYTMEDEYLAGLTKTLPNGISRLEYARLMRGELHPALEWWRDNYDLLRNFITRRYPLNLVSYKKLLSSPEEVIPPVIEWCGGGNINAALEVVKPSLNTQKNITKVDDSPLTKEQETVFDELHDHFYKQVPLKLSFIEILNKVDDELKPLIKRQKEYGLIKLKQKLRECGMSEANIKDESEKQKAIQREIGF